MDALLLILMLGAAGPIGDAAGAELSYSGRLTPVAVADGPAAEKGFQVAWFLRSRSDGTVVGTFSVAEDADALPWTDRFGTEIPPGGEGGPRIGYRFGERVAVVPLPGAVFPHAGKLADGADFTEGPLRFAVTGEKSIDGRPCFAVDVSTNFGRQTTLAVSKSDGLIVSYDQAVFLGRGDRFRLTLDLSEFRSLNAAEADRRSAVGAALVKLKESVGDRVAGSTVELPSERIEAAVPAARDLAAAAADTPFAPLAAAVARGLDDQTRRAAGVAGLAKRIVGSPAPPLALRTIDGRAVEPSALAGKTVVLQFWDYDDAALDAPYGQVGYLDFLDRKRRPLGVAVYGVAVHKPGTKAAAVKSARKLAEFMNLGYPIAVDDGTLLKAFGDPREVGGMLPLWVVVGPDGVVRHFHAGLYDLKPNEGLTELDAAVAALVGKTPAATSTAEDAPAKP